MKKVTILVPCHNEEESLPLLYETVTGLMDNEPKWKEYEWELLLVDDGSTDKTVQVMKSLYEKDKRISYIELSRNFGKENAMFAGLTYAQGDCVVIMDADLQHPPHVITQMLAKWEEGYEDVYGKRITRGKESWMRKHMSLLYYRLVQKFVRYEMLPNVGDFRLLDRKCVDSLKEMKETERYTKGLYCFIGFRKTGVEFETQDRVAGQSSWSTRQLFGLAIEGMVSFTTIPLKIATMLGIIVSLGSFIYMICVLVKTLFWGEVVRGYPTLLTIILFLSGIQLLTVGILGEYIGRIYTETKRRPAYIVREYKKAESSNDK
jgi:glycosyltransferase involved in cell wall biosynthesis